MPTRSGVAGVDNPVAYAVGGRGTTRGSAAKTVGCAKSSILGCTYDELVVIVTATFAGNIPSNDPGRRRQYAFVFDSEGAASNNYVPPAQIAGDFFAGTDRWHSAGYNRTDGCVLTVLDVVNNQPVAATSCARLIVRENAMVLVVPQSDAVDCTRQPISPTGRIERG